MLLFIIVCSLAMSVGPLIRDTICIRALLWASDVVGSQALAL